LAGGVVDHKAGGVAEALRAKARPVPVSRQDKQVNSVGDGVDDFTFRAPAALQPLDALPAEAFCSRSKDGLARFVLGSLKTQGLPVALQRPPEQAGEGGFGEFFSVSGAHVEEGHVGVGRQCSVGGIDAALPGPLNEPDDGSHRSIIARRAGTCPEPGQRVCPAERHAL
jgi:hypothetical protein